MGYEENEKQVLQEGYGYKDFRKLQKSQKTRKDSRHRIIVLVILVFVFMFGLHFLDLGDVLSEDGGLGCNGVWCIDGVVLQHWFGMYVMVGAFFIQTFLYCWRCFENS